MNLKNYKVLVLLITSILTTACAPVYVVPQVGPKAKLGILNQKLLLNQNMLFIYDDPIACKGAHVLGDLKHRYSGEPVSIPANRLTTIMDQHTVLGYYPTETALTFYPEPNQTYLVTTSNHNIISLGEYGKMEFDFNILKEVKTSNGKVEYVQIDFIKREIKSTWKEMVCIDEAVQEKLRKKALNLK